MSVSEEEPDAGVEAVRAELAALAGGDCARQARVVQALFAADAAVAAGAWQLADSPELAGPEARQVTAALTALARLRSAQGDVERVLTEAAREQGVSWEALAEIGGLGSRQAAERRYLRLLGSRGAGGAAAEAGRAARSRRTSPHRADESRRRGKPDAQVDFDALHAALEEAGYQPVTDAVPAREDTVRRIKLLATYQRLTPGRRGWMIGGFWGHPRALRSPDGTRVDLQASPDAVVAAVLVTTPSG